MSDDTTEQPVHEPVEVTVDLPGRIVDFYDRLTEAGVFLSRADAIRQAVTNSWRFERGSFHNLRLDLKGHKEDEDDADEAEEGGGPESAPSSEN